MRAVLITAFAALALAPLADAATVSMPTPARVVVTPAAGETVQLQSTIIKRFSRGVLTIELTDGAPLSLSGSHECVNDTPSKVACFLPSTAEFGPLRLEATLGAGNDAFRFTGGGPEAKGRFGVFVDAGDGDNVLWARVTPGGTIINGELTSGAGADDLKADFRGGFMRAGGGSDKVVSHSSAGTVTDGGAGVDDLTEQGAGSIFGGGGDDIILGPGAVTIDGGDGNDNIFCGAGCAGGAGDDLLKHGGTQFGGPGNDRLQNALVSASGDGCSGGWTTCSPGADGNDQIFIADLAKQDGYSTATRAQRATCGGGLDTVDFDPRDEVAADCETKNMGTGSTGV